jgi:hypothetical protein
MKCYYNGQINNAARSEVLTVVLLKKEVFWDVRLSC